MAFLLKEDAEPIPGYRFIKRLGSGGFGEVWKATAPGELTKAIKIVHGHLNESRAEQELKALSRIKEVRHPFLLSLERIEIIDGQLLIVTELADMSLQDRFQQCQQAGLRGIPREELLANFRDAADALDYMQEKYGLQHLDIKPQNLLLVAGRIKIADFGLVKELYGTSATATGGVTPVYAPPEAFDGRVSRFSDQYSLAIVYQEMLTAVRPFPGKTALQLANQHTSSPPMLDPLPPPDRLVIARALAKIPERRFPSCREMVQQLLGSPAPSAPPARPLPAPLAKKEKVLPARPSAPVAPSVKGRTDCQSVPPHRPDPEVLLELPTEPGSKLHEQLPATAVAQNQGAPQQLLRLDECYSQLQLRPTLFLGIGGLAGQTLRRLRHKLQGRFGDLARVPCLRMLLLDTDRAILQAPPGDAEPDLSPEEKLLIPLRRPEDYRDKSKDLLRWLDRRWLYGTPRSRQTEGLRPLGRLALVDNAAEVMAGLRAVITLITRPEAQAAAVQATGITQWENVPRIVILASICGGAGGGMLCDVAFWVRQILDELALSSDGLCGFLAYLTGPKPAERELGRVNAYATLRELHHFNRLDTSYPGEPAAGVAPSPSSTGPFHDCYLVHLGDQLSEADLPAAAGFLAEYLSIEVATPAGRFFDEYRHAMRSGAHRPESDMSLRTFGLHRVGFPRLDLARHVADRLCQQLLLGWRGNDTDPPMDPEPLPPVCQQELASGALQNRLLGTLQAAWKEEAETHFSKLLANWSGHDALCSGQTPSDERIEEALRWIESQLAPGPEDPPPSAVPLDAALSEHVAELARQLAQRELEWLLGIVETPGKRIRAAQRSAKWLTDSLATTAENSRTERAAVHARVEVFRRQLLSGEFEKNKGSGAGWLGRWRRPDSVVGPPKEMVAYCCYRLGEVIMDTVPTVLAAVSARITRFLEELHFCRKQLSTLAGSFGADVAGDEMPSRSPVMVASLKELFPNGAKSLGEAVDVVFQRLDPQILRQLDEAAQVNVLNEQGGLRALSSEPGEMAKKRKVALQEQALAFIVPVLADVDVAELFLETHTEPGQVEEALLGSIQSTLPRLPVPEGGRYLLAGTPDSPAGADLSETLSRLIVDQPISRFLCDDAIVLCQEATYLPLQVVANSLIGNEIRYAETAQQVLTRVDISWAPLEQGQP